MVICLKRLKRSAAGILILTALLITLWTVFSRGTSQLVMGGFVHKNNKPELEYTYPVFYGDEANDYSERFQRPSKQPALELKYAGKDLINTLGQPPSIQKIFQTPEDVIHAYYAILKEASNMIGYHGGCGTIGWAKEPYPYAYELLSRETKEQMSLDEFIESFSGVGHITLLKLYPAYQPPGTPANTRYYMTEIEVITGAPHDEQKKNKPHSSYFAYYYGLITTRKTPSEGWKIEAFDYFPEDFLCAPYHHWYWDAEAVVAIVYKEWYKLIKDIEKVEKNDSIVRIYASGTQSKYRFDFVRLTNGVDVLLHEYIRQNGQWKEVNLLKEKDQFYKLSILNPSFKRKN